jgi:hypothetical protein
MSTMRRAYQALERPQASPWLKQGGPCMSRPQGCRLPEQALRVYMQHQDIHPEGFSTTPLSYHRLRCIPGTLVQNLQPLPMCLLVGELTSNAILIPHLTSYLLATIANASRSESVYWKWIVLLDIRNKYVSLVTHI